MLPRLLPSPRAHPPWDLSRDEVAKLEPSEYHGLLEARRGGIILSSIRSRGRLSQRRLPTQDWIRLQALSGAALAKQDQALGELMQALDRQVLHVLVVHPTDLVRVEAGRRLVDAGDVEGLLQLGEGHHLAVVARAPAQKRQKVVQRLVLFN